MSEWRKCKLGDILKINYGKGLPEQNRYQGNVPVYSSAGITGWHNSPLVNSIGIIIGRKGTVGSVYYSDKPFYCIDTAYYVEPNEKIYDINYLFYLLNTIGLKELNEDSAVPGLNRNTAYDQDIYLPPLPKQQAIAAMLSSLDHKIDLLHRQNKTLEAMAETIWRKIFIEDADSGWEKGKLGDLLVTIETGRRPKGGINPNLYLGIPSIGAENINGIGYYDYSKTKYVTEEFYTNMKSGKIQDYDILIYKDGAYIGKKSMFANGFPFTKCCINEHVFILRTININIQLFLYFSLEQDELEQLNANSAQPGINQESLKSFNIIIPNKNIINDFGNKIKPLIDKIFYNSIQIHKLSQLRDTLLPKLMSGEVRIRV